MKIAHLLPYSALYPLKIYNARYSWALQLAQLQAQRGHQVTLYCHPEGQATSVEIRGINTPTEDGKTNNLATIKLALQDDHDIYHSHFDNLHYAIGQTTTKPIVFTQHWWPYEETTRLAQAYKGHNIWAVPPTRYMYTYDIEHGIQTRGHIYHGIDLSIFQPTADSKNGRLLSASRISPEKNLEVSIAIAKRSGLGLDIVGKVAPKKQDYWQSLLPHIDGEQIRYLGPMSQVELVKHYTAAQAVLFPSDPREPFGLVAIEAQACGAPIIMAAGGSRHELVRDRTTGFLCSSIDEYVQAAHESATLSPDVCRQFAQQFDINTMADNYQQLYENLTR